MAVVSYYDMLTTKHAGIGIVIAPTGCVDSRCHATAAFLIQGQKFHFRNLSVSFFPGLLVSILVVGSSVLNAFGERIMLHEISNGVDTSVSPVKLLFDFCAQSVCGAMCSMCVTTSPAVLWSPVQQALMIVQSRSSLLAG